jgi:hypothetical protein
LSSSPQPQPSKAQHNHHATPPPLIIIITTTIIIIIIIIIIIMITLLCCQDIWSLGLTLLECALGQYPYPDTCSCIEMVQAITESDVPSLRECPL